MKKKQSDWQVLLIGGASGTGKTSVSYRLARYFDIGITEVDDFHVMLEKMTTPEQQPILHYWRTHPEAALLPAQEIVEQLIAFGKVMTPGIEAVIANHIESNMPIVLEGDFILPELAATFASEVCAIFLNEPSEQQLLDNFSQREPTSVPQTKRAQVSCLYGQWLKKEAQKYGVTVIPARPWDSAFNRILSVISVCKTI